MHAEADTKKAEDERKQDERAERIRKLELYPDWDEVAAFSDATPELAAFLDAYAGFDHMAIQTRVKRLVKAWAEWTVDK